MAEVSFRVGCSCDPQPFYEGGNEHQARRFYRSVERHGGEGHKATFEIGETTWTEVEIKPAALRDGQVHTVQDATP